MTTRQVFAWLRAYESRHVTFFEPDGSWPIVWNRARGVHVWDVEGRKYLDLTAAFGVMAAGHANPRVVKAGQRQMALLLHGMGDVHPHPLKAQLARALSRITFERWNARKSRASKSKRGLSHGKTIFCNSGFEAVEAALKTALLATGKRGVIAFAGGYHGLGYGALHATHRKFFRSPFRKQLSNFGQWLPFPSRTEELPALERGLRRAFRQGPVGAILVEPIQVRGGMNVPPPEFLALLGRLCREHDALLVLDEIYTGFGRTGHWFACEHGGVIPDLICLGKALTGGFPLSACVGRAELMDAAWPESAGEALHTSTFLGHPVGCAMALAEIQELETRQLAARSAQLGSMLVEALARLRPPPSWRAAVRGRGLAVGLELQRVDGTPAQEFTFRVVKEMLHRGFILLPEGEHGNVIGFTPPLVISKRELLRSVAVLGEVLKTQR